MTSYFVHLYIEKQGEEAYVLKTYEADAFEVAKTKFDAICAGEPDEKLQEAFLVQRENPAMVIVAELVGVEYDEAGEFPISSQLYDTHKWTH